MQGVTYRETTRRKATLLGLTGTVENLPHGDVQIIATGEHEVLQQLSEWCYRGPQLATVSDVICTEIPLREFDEFCIKR